MGSHESAKAEPDATAPAVATEPTDDAESAEATPQKESKNASDVTDNPIIDLLLEPR